MTSSKFNAKTIVKMITEFEESYTDYRTEINRRQSHEPYSDMKIENFYVLCNKWMNMNLSPAHFERDAWIIFDSFYAYRVSELKPKDI